MQTPSKLEDTLIIYNAYKKSNVEIRSADWFLGFRGGCDVRDAWAAAPPEPGALGQRTRGPRVVAGACGAVVSRFIGHGVFPSPQNRRAGTTTGGGPKLPIKPEKSSKLEIRKGTFLKVIGTERRGRRHWCQGGIGLQTVRQWDTDRTFGDDCCWLTVGQQLAGKKAELLYESSLANSCIDIVPPICRKKYTQMCTLNETE